MALETVPLHLDFSRNSKGFNMLKFDTQNLGEFQEKTCGKWFTYRLTSNPWALSNGLNFEIDVLDGVRFAKVKKTVVHVCVNEDDSGQPILEIWQLNKHYQPHYQPHYQA